MNKGEINQLKNVLPWFLQHKMVWSSYDREVDVLYIHFKKPNHADDSEMTDEDIIIRYENDEIVGLTVLNASKLERESV